MLRFRPEQLDLRSYLQPGDGVVTSQGSAEPQALTRALRAQADSLSVSIFLGGGSFSGTFTPEHAGNLRFTGYGGVGDHRRLIRAGLMEILPVHVSRLPHFIGREIPCDVAMLQVAGPRKDGNYSYSLASDYMVEAVTRARVVIAELNHNAPNTCCEVPLHPSNIDVLVESDEPLIQLPSSPVGDLERAIASHIAEFIGDHSTLQIGYGCVPEAIIATLRDRKDLGLHTGVIGDSIVALIERGVITNASKEVLPGRSVTGALWGTQRLYRFVDENPDVQLTRITTTHGAESLGRLSRLVSINSAIEVDLTGQVNAEQIGSEYVGAIGGQVDFVRAGARAPLGASIITLASTAREGTVSRIVSRLNGPVTTARSEVDVVATEHGAVRLRGLSLKLRVKRMIDLAEDKFRETLSREAYDLYGVR